MEHKTGATDIVLRYDEAGGFMMAGYSASQAPHFTLYGDGTVIFRNPMLELPAAQGSVMTFNPMRTAKLSEEQRRGPTASLEPRSAGTVWPRLTVPRTLSVWSGCR